MTIPAEQVETAALLTRLTGAQPHETHISAVFAGADLTLKLRKAVRLPFVDFSTLAERRRTAHREMELNAPHAPGLYRAVRPILRAADGTLSLGPGDGPAAGETIDWVVEMASIPPEQFFDAIAARGGLSESLLDAIADAVATYHRALPPVARDQAAALLDIVAGNVATARAAGLPEADVDRWHDGMRAALELRRGWLRARVDSGHVRRAHGDLHLGNLCLWDKTPVPFDALEFDEDLATIDVAYDLAFLLMDLEHRAGRAAANRVLNRYVARTGDHGLVGGLPPFLSMRAMVRAHVEASRGDQEAAHAYLATALEHLAPPAPVMVAIGGLPGTGKSTLARAIAPELGAAPGALILRSDEIRKRRWHCAPEERLPEAAYAAGETQGVFAELIEAAAEAVKLGHAVIADTMFVRAPDREAARRAAGAARFTGVWLTAPHHVLEARVWARHGDASDATVEVLRRVAGSHDPPGAAERWAIIDATEREATIAAVRHSLGRVPD